MGNFRIVVLPGDGIGPEVTAEAVTGLRAVGRRVGLAFEFEDVIGGAPSTTPASPCPRPRCASPSRHAVLSARWAAEVGRPEVAGAPRAGAARHPASTRPVREPASGEGGRGAAGDLHPQAGGAARRRHPRHPRAHRRHLLRQAEERRAQAAARRSTRWSTTRRRCAAWCASPSTWRAPPQER